jgi:hypothetical protein
MPTLPPFSLCPFRSPVEIPAARHVLSATPESQEPRQALGACLGLGCGMWCVTKIEGGRPTDGMCAMRLAAGALSEIANRLQVRGTLHTVPPPPPESDPISA